MAPPPGVEGQLTLIGIEVPIHTKVKLAATAHTDQELAQQGRNIQGTGWEGDAGEPPTGIPSDRVYSWNLNWGFGAHLNLTTLSGSLAAAARVQFLWYSKTFRKKIADFTGPTLSIPLADASVDLSLPLPSVPAGQALDPFSGPLNDAVGWAGEKIGFNAMKQEGVGPQLNKQYFFVPSASDDICKPRLPQLL